jgi:hypothetical protein
MNILTPAEFAAAHGYKPFPPRWDRWLNSVREAILTAQPQVGHNTTTDEHPGKGTIINVDRKAAPAGTGACCIGEDCSILSEAACIAAGGTFQGVGTVCDPNPCGACPAGMTTAFSGISVDCGCIDWHSGDVNAFNATDVDVNRSYSLTKDAFTPCNFYSASDHDIVEVKRYFSTGCDGLKDDLNYQDALAIFFTAGYWRIWYQSSFNPFNFVFYARVAGSTGFPPSPIANQITTCSSTPWNDDPDFEALFGFPPSDMQAIGHGGSLTITP